MNIYTQMLSIALGGLLSVSEILPFVKNVKTNGIIHFVVSSLLKDNDGEDTKNDMEHQPLLNEQTRPSYTVRDDSTSTSENEIKNNSSLQMESIDENCKVSGSTGLFIEDQNADQLNILIDKVNEINTELLNDALDVNMQQLQTHSAKHLKVLSEMQKSFNDNTSDILMKLKEIKEEKTGSFASKNVEDIVEMILQHLQDLQRSQMQWTQNYGDNTLKNDIKFENIINQIDIIKDSIKESVRVSVNDTIKDSNLNNNTNDDNLNGSLNESLNGISLKIQQQLENQFEWVNDNFTKQSSLIDGLTLQVNNLVVKMDEITDKLGDVNDKIDRKKRKNNFLGGGKDL